ncbi:hypothetical protein [Marinagarivorans cellulosilyticus]|uniref:Uncharacterized protein n=1 Tax=Marinagarivorans cellulosilyticus TaxID=2721545 RepID=A0AAN2BJW8_9GAMM|nr:hypothetical protein [Marinagarivorans cellulosilyticus]BCD97380.1 hypothetical protein MARGE09_P1581 [Marinagarivorans cellulosilyticus]
MTGEYIIQNSTMLRGQGYLQDAINCIENNIAKISPWLRPTAWVEAKFAAEELGLKDKALEFEQKEKVAKTQAEQPLNRAPLHVSCCGLNNPVPSL